MLHFIGPKDIKIQVRNYIQSCKNLKDKIVIDIPAGRGYTSKLLKQQGAKVYAFDLFPEFFALNDVHCQFADLNRPLPIDNEFADYVICQEGIEHLSDQLAVFQEFNRILKKNGRLIITTPNNSQLRNRASHLFLSSPHYKQFPVHILNAVFFSDNTKKYFGHISLLDIHKLRLFANIAGFKIIKLHPVKANLTSVFLGVFLYPFIAVFNIYAYILNLRKNQHIEKTVKKQQYQKIVQLNLHPNILFGGHLFVEFTKILDIKKHQPSVYKKESEIY